MKVGEKEVSLRYAYAIEEAPELRFPDAPKGEFDLILVDNPVNQAELDCRSLLIHRVRKGELHGILLVFDPAKKCAHRGNLLYEKQSLFFSILELGPNDNELREKGQEHLFEGSLTPERIAGKVWMPKEYQSEIAGPEPTRFRYEATVETPIRRPGPITATLTGKAARQSPQAKALFAFCKAVRAGSVAGMQASGVTAQMAVLTGPDGKEILQAIRQGAPDPAKLTVSKVIVHGNMAILQGRAGKDGNMTMKCLREGRLWKISMN